MPNKILEKLFHTSLKEVASIVQDYKTLFDSAFEIASDGTFVVTAQQLTKITAWHSAYGGFVSLVTGLPPLTLAFTEDHDANRLCALFAHAYGYVCYQRLVNNE